MKKNLIVEGFEKLKAAFNEYEAEQKERFKNFSVGLLKSSKVPQEANVPGAGWVKFVLLTHNELSDLAKFYKDDQREFELQALLKMMKPCYPDLTEKDLRMRHGIWCVLWRRRCLMRVFYRVR